MIDIFEKAVGPIISDPISLILLVLLTGALIVASVAGKRAAAAERISRRISYARATGDSGQSYEIGQANLGEIFDEELDTPSPFAKALRMLAPVAGQLPLIGEKDRAKVQRTLVVAGYRSSEAINMMLAAKLASGLFLGVTVYTVVVSGDQPLATGLKAFLSLPVGVMLGAMAPEFYVKWRAKRRQRKISQAVPDALDLMVICAEAGLTLETALYRVSRELKTSNPELALELATTEAELKVLPERRMALENLVYRTEAPEMASLSVTMNQAEKYGTSLSQALRTISAEGRRSRMLRIEEKAARLPALMSLPLMVFILPPCGVIVGGPAMVRLMGSLAG